MPLKLSNYPLEEIITDFADGNLSNSELKAFSELQSVDSDFRKRAWSAIKVRRALNQLKKVGVGSGFDRRMAAKFALELENEVRDCNLKQLHSNDKVTNH